MQNLVFFKLPPLGSFDISEKAEVMYLNRFCIDEDSSFELSGVYDLSEPNRVTHKIRKLIFGTEKAKGKVNSLFLGLL